jgi:hypothetical protein
MTCKSHAFLLVLAVLPAPTAATAAVAHAAALANSVHHYYRCGLGAFAGHVVGMFFGGIALLVACAIGAKLRDRRFRRATQEIVSPLVAGHVLASLARRECVGRASRRGARRVHPHRADARTRAELSVRCRPREGHADGHRSSSFVPDSRRTGVADRHRALRVEARKRGHFESAYSIHGVVPSSLEL